MQRLSLGFLLIALVATSASPVRADAGLACEMPADLITPSDPLSHVAAALTSRDTLSVLALGSGSTVGESGGSNGPAYRSPEGAFPYKMLSALQAMQPSAHFQLTVKGGRNMTADAMLLILQQELAGHHYDLVLWQTGTVEAVHGLRPDGLRDVLQQGAEAVEQAKADLVLIDPQFSRFLRANADLSPYETILQQMTGNDGVTLFHRLDLTQTWVGTGQIDLERVSRDQRDKTIVLLNECLGQALARFILTGAKEH
jgi:acyl-CoA thioesterase-1